jgi:RNA polymerase sigma factor (sigma-70 family)
MPPDDLRLETLLAESEWLRALARRLCADPHQADDLAQETWLRALSRLPDARSSPRAWLARVLINLNISRARSDARRSQRESRVARVEAQPSSADIAERSQIARALAEHVLELEEPGRSAILAHFFEGLEVEEIAKRQSKSAAAVRAELRAGLEGLRQRLERSEGPEWLVALVPLAASGRNPARALRATRRAPGKLAAAALLLLGSATIIGLAARPRSGSATAAPEPEALAVESARSGSVPETEAGPRRRAEGAVPVTVEARATAQVSFVPPTLAAGTIRGVVVRRAGEQDTPIEGATVFLWDYAEGCSYGLERLRSETVRGLAPLAETRSASGGAFRFSGLEPKDYLVGAVVAGTSLRTGHFKLEDPAQSRTRVRGLALVLGDASLHGCVRDEDGLPLAGVPINLCRVLHPELSPGIYEDLRVSTDTGTDGRYSIDALPAGMYLLTIGNEDATHWPGRRGRLTLVAADSVELNVGEAFPAPHWRGTILCAQGEPTASAGELQLHRTFETPLGSSLDVLRIAPLGAGGRFDATLECARWIPNLILPSSPGCKHVFETVEIGRAGLERDLGLPGARLRGRVLDALTRQPPANPDGALRVRLHRPDADPTGIGAPLDAEGRFVVEMLEPGKWLLAVESLALADGAAALEFTIDSGEHVHDLLVCVRAP